MEYKEGKMKFLIFGLGALGTVFATCLKSSGHTVYAFVKEKHLTNLKDRKLKVTGLFGEKEAEIDGYFINPEDLKNKAIDLIILSVKAFDTHKAVSQIQRFIKPDTLVLLAQNGYGNYEIAKELLGKEKVILGRVIFGARVIEPGYAEVTVIADDVVIGQPDKAISLTKLEEIAQIFREAGIPTRVSEEVYAILWDKILYNSALNPLGALLECTYGDLARIEETRVLMNKIIEEIFEVTKANGIQLNWKNAEEYKKHFYEKLIPPTAKHFPSMYYDLRSGKRTEIDALNGAIVKLAKKVGLKAEVNEVITNLVKAKEKLNLKNS
jgi:2-dehydropantoate 2-reductase